MYLEVFGSIVWLLGCRGRRVVTWPLLAYLFEWIDKHCAVNCVECVAWRCRTLDCCYWWSCCCGLCGCSAAFVVSNSCINMAFCTNNTYACMCLYIACMYVCMRALFVHDLSLLILLICFHSSAFSGVLTYYFQC